MVGLLAGLPAGEGGEAAVARLLQLAADFQNQAGDTRHRFRWLAAVCAQDVVLGKLFESHLDALEILRELAGADGAAALVDAAGGGGGLEGLWGVWAAEGPGQLVAQTSDSSASPDAPCVVTGRKSWCSGAARVAGALVTARDADGVSGLFAVPLRHVGITVTDEGWQAVGMAGTASVDVLFDRVPAWPVGQPGDYTGRPGFWHGAAGIAACWHGAATAIAAPLRDRVRQGGKDGQEADALLAMHLGAVDCALSASAHALRAAAAHIDLHRAGGLVFGRREALAVRGTTEGVALTVVEKVGRALGAEPLCRDERHARRVADLSVFLRQSHAEWDLVALGRLAARQGQEDRDPWTL